MVEQFIKLKKRAATRAILLSLVTAVSVAAIVVGGLLVAVKLTGIAFPWWGYLAAGGGSFAIVFALLVAALYPTTKRYSRKLDEEYALGEKVQTMVEFSGQAGAVLDLQRENTEVALETLPKKKRSFGGIVKRIALPILAVAVVGAAVVVPKKYVPEPLPEAEKPWQSGKYQVKDMEALIANVAASNLTENLKPAYLATLNDLLARMQAPTTTTSEMIRAVNESMNLILSITKQANSYNAFVEGLKENEELEALSAALKESGEAYKTVEGININSYATLSSKEGELAKTVSAKLTAYGDTVNASVADLDEAAFSNFVNSYVSEIDILLLEDEIAALAEGEAIRTATTEFKTSLAEAVTAEGLSLNGRKGEVNKAVEAYQSPTGALASELNIQSYSYMLRDYTLQGLSNIFGVNVPSEDGNDGPIEDPDDRPPEDAPPEDKDYPNEGEVLDPSDGTYKPYYELVDKYYDNVLALLAQDKENVENGEEPQISEELRNYLTAYFQSLKKK